MKQKFTKQESSEKQETTEAQQTSPQTQPREFGSVEEMLRYDVSQVSPPASVAARLQDSVATAQAAQRPWWRRWFWR
jgi:hypothetical protein